MPGAIPASFFCFGVAVAGRRRLLPAKPGLTPLWGQPGAPRRRAGASLTALFPDGFLAALRIAASSDDSSHGLGHPYRHYAYPWGRRIPIGGLRRRFPGSGASAPARSASRCTNSKS